jgi:RNA 2',3'-cyclic 3'-phosphodiesterase
VKGILVRTFIAIDLEPGLKTALQDLVRVLKTTKADVRWAQANSLHLTLKFLGEIDEEKATVVKRILGQVAGRQASFPLRLEGMGAFPGEHRPRVLWAGFAAEPGLLAFQDELEHALEREGFPREERAFHPHLTLGRVKGPGRIHEAMLELEKHRNGSLGEMTVHKVALFESRLRPEGAEYLVLADYELK